jgi:hypothetical protein
LAAQGEECIRCAAGSGHLIHDATRSADDEIFDHLAPDRQRGSIDITPRGSDEGTHGRDFNGCR